MMCVSVVFFLYLVCVFFHVAKLSPSAPAHQALEAAGRPFSKQISTQCRLEAPSWSSARAVGRSTASG